MATTPAEIGNDGADGDVDALRRDDEGQPDGQEHDGRGVLDDVDHVAVEVAILDLDVEEVGREEQVEQA